MKFSKLINKGLRQLDVQMGTTRRRRTSGTKTTRTRTGNPPTGNRRGSHKVNSD